MRLCRHPILGGRGTIAVRKIQHPVGIDQLVAEVDRFTRQRVHGVIIGFNGVGPDQEEYVGFVGVLATLVARIAFVAVIALVTGGFSGSLLLVASPDFGDETVRLFAFHIQLASFGMK